MPPSKVTRLAAARQRQRDKMALYRACETWIEEAAQAEAFLADLADRLEPIMDRLWASMTNEERQALLDEAAAHPDKYLII